MVTNRSIQVSAPSRLHFGLFSIGPLTDYQFGGAGLMIDGPRTQMTAQPADRFSVSIVASIGSQTERDELTRTIDTTIERWFAAMKQSHVQLLELECWRELPVHLNLQSVPPRHAGFGSGTQLAFTAALAVTQLLGLTVPSAIEMALGDGTGEAVGHWFVWILERWVSGGPRQVLRFRAGQVGPASGLSCAVADRDFGWGFGAIVFRESGKRVLRTFGINFAPAAGCHDCSDAATCRPGSFERGLRNVWRRVVRIWPAVWRNVCGGSAWAIQRATVRGTGGRSSQDWNSGGWAEFMGAVHFCDLS